MACAPGQVGGASGPWTGEAAIALARSFGSPVGFACVIAWDLRDDARANPSDLQVEVRFPSAVQDLLVTTTPAGQPMTRPWPRYDEWRPWTTEVNGEASLEAMAQRKHLVGVSGVPCRTQDATAAMRSRKCTFTGRPTAASRTSSSP